MCLLLFHLVFVPPCHVVSGINIVCLFLKLPRQREFISRTARVFGFQLSGILLLLLLLLVGILRSPRKLWYS